MSLSALYPPFYERWLSRKLAGSVREEKATCDRCAMVSPEGLTRDQGPFREDLKCCTYFPFLPNFTVGALLEKRDPVFDVRFRLAQEQGLLLPVGLYPTPERQRRMDEDREEFGRKPELLCPFFDKAHKGCSIWQHRPAVCTTYFCKSNYDEEGFEFWADLEDELNHFEWVMATEIFARLDLDEAEMEACRGLMTTVAGSEREALLARSWGRWRGREDAFFREAWRQAQNIDEIELEELMGEEAQDLEADLRERVARFQKQSRI